MLKLFKVLGALILLVVIVAGGAFLWARQVSTAKYQKMWTAHEATFPIPFPLDSVEIDALARERIAAGAGARDPLAGVDLEAVALDRAQNRGQHLVESRLGCLACHGPDAGGNVVINVPVVGYWAAPNLTSGPGSVTNGFSPRDWDLAVRHGIRHTGQSSSMPSGEFVNLSDRELSDVVSYIRSRPAVDRNVGPVRLGPVFTFLTATDPTMLAAFVIDHQKPHALEPPAEAVTLELGEHIVATCRGCHQQNLAGGKVQGDPNMPIVANITPHETGLKDWTEGDFIRSMREGKRPNGTAISETMPWKSYAKMTDTELKAVWLYLRSVPPLPKGK